MIRPSSFQDSIGAHLAPHGLHLRGTARFPQGEAGPLLDDGQAARAVLLIGNIGGSMWQAFGDWRAGQSDRGGREPLDTWSKRIIGQLATKTGATAYFPSDPPYQPFQRWAMSAEGLKASPLGILIHPEFGLWHGYRGALGFAEDISEPEKTPVSAPLHPCDDCKGRPCLAACPAGAITAVRFDLAACRKYLASEPGREGCMGKGCLARAACPVGEGFRYPEDQIRFHMDALVPPSDQP
ncbi:MAG: ferredoxin [Rhizobium sp.]|nr:ferredoxin [Rhizobium sp.]